MAIDFSTQIVKLSFELGLNRYFLDQCHHILNLKIRHLTLLKIACIKADVKLSYKYFKN